MAAETPYPIAMTVYDTDGTTAISGVRVTAFNTTKDEKLPYSAEVLTNSSGQAVIDLANFPTDYENSDEIQIVAYVTKKSIEVRHTINTTTGYYAPTTMVLHWGGAYIRTVKISEISVSNYDTVSRYVDFYDRDSPSALRRRITVPPRDTRSVTFMKDDEFFFKGGVNKDLSTRTANIIFVSIKAKSVPY